MGVQGTYFYRPSYGAQGNSEYNSFNSGLTLADAELSACSGHRSNVTSAHGLSISNGVVSSATSATYAANSTSATSAINATLANSVISTEYTLVDGTRAFTGATTGTSGYFSATLSADDLITTKPWVDVRAYTTLALANTAAYDNGKTLLITKECTLPANTTLTAAVKVIKGGSFTKASTYTLTINGPFEAGLYTVFSGFSAGDVTFGAGSVKEVYPQWWGAVGVATDDGAAIQAANDALPDRGGRVYLTTGTYGITQPLNISPYTTLIGAGHWATEIRALSGFSGAAMIQNEIQDGGQMMLATENMTVNGNKTVATVPIGILYKATGQLCYIRNVHVFDVSGNGIVLDGGQLGESLPTACYYMDNVWVTTCNDDQIKVQNQIAGVFMNRVTAEWMAAGKAAIHFAGNAADYGRYFISLKDIHIEWDAANCIGILINEFKSIDICNLMVLPNATGDGVKITGTIAETDNITIRNYSCSWGANAINDVPRSVTIPFTGTFLHIPHYCTSSTAYFLRGYRQTYATSIPIVGTWAVGDICWHSDAAAGEPLGWYCTEAGTPGTWKAMANLAA